MALESRTLRYARDLRPDPPVRVAFIRDHHVFWHQAVAAVAVFFTAVGIHDLLQPRHSILRNYPVLGHVRWSLS